MNAYVLEADPSGSSTGSAVSVSANLVAVSLGTETDGSIISPSARNGVVGLKTTFGVVPTGGLLQLSFSSDVVRITKNFKLKVFCVIFEINFRLAPWPDQLVMLPF